MLSKGALNILSYMCKDEFRGSIEWHEMKAMIKHDLDRLNKLEQAFEILKEHIKLDSYKFGTRTIYTLNCKKYLVKEEYEELKEMW